MARDEFIDTVWAYLNPGGVSEPVIAVQEQGYGAIKPPYQGHNWIFNLLFGMVQNAEFYGVMEWNTNTLYPINGKCTGSDGIVYRAVIANGGEDPIADDGTNWLTWMQTTENPYVKKARFRHTETSGTDGGTYTTASTWQDRKLNDDSHFNRITGLSLASGTGIMTFPVGTFGLSALYAVSGIDASKLGLYNITAGAFIDTGLNLNDDDITGGNQALETEFTLGVISQLKLQTYGTASQSTTGFGRKVTSGEDEVYGNVDINQLD